LKLLLDEMYPPAIAEQLRARDHDVVAVTEHPALRSIPDEQLFAYAQTEQRAVVTENARDYRPIADARAARGRSHFGLVLVDSSKYPRGVSRTIGRMVTGLGKLLSMHPGDDATGLVHWL